MKHWLTFLLKWGIVSFIDSTIIVLIFCAIKSEGWDLQTIVNVAKYIVPPTTISALVTFLILERKYVHTCKSK